MVQRLGKMTARGDTMPKSTLVIYEALPISETGATRPNSRSDFMPGVKFKADAVKGELVEEIEGANEADSDYYLGWCLFSCETIKTFKRRLQASKPTALKSLPAGCSICFHITKSMTVLLMWCLPKVKADRQSAFHYQKLLTAIYLPTTLRICGDNKLNGEEL